VPGRTDLIAAKEYDNPLVTPTHNTKNFKVPVMEFVNLEPAN
jgi:hypothetical protein